MNHLKTKRPKNSDPAGKISGSKVSISDILAVALNLFLLLSFFPIRFWLFEVVNNLVHWFLLPSLAVTIFMLVKQRWLKGAMWGIPALVFIILFGELFLPSIGTGHVCRSGQENSCWHMRVMTFNMLARYGTDRQVQIDMMRNSDAKIIALQELNDVTAALIEEQLIDLYPHQVLYPGHVKGIGIISKYPILNHEILKLGSGWMSHLHTVLDVGPYEITIISAHPPPSVMPTELFYDSRTVDEIIALGEIATENAPAILMGDFNITDQSTDYHYLSDAGLKDAHREMGWGFGSTWPAKTPGREWFTPLIRIDHIWYTEEFKVESVWTGPRSNSDHLPVLADIIFEEN